MSQEESELVQQAKAGDPEAFAELYRRYQPKIYRYIAFRVNNVATAEDLTSEVFVRLVERIDDFSYRGRPLLAWLYTIARNLLTDHYRRSGRSQSYPLDESLVADTPDPVQRAHYAVQGERLTEALQDLTEDQRQVLLLKFFEDMDNPTAAKVLGKSVGAVKALQHRGLAALARIFARQESD
jgi:RNA polymerase sigma-70 factor (ECF subfamily)